MRLLFDLSQTQPIGNSKFHGGGKYGLMVINKLMDIAPSSLAVYYDDKKYVDENTIKRIQEYNLPIYKKSKITLFDAARRESSVIYAPMYNSLSSGLPPLDIKLIQTQHGLRIMEMPDDKYQKKYFPKNVYGVKTLLQSIKLLWNKYRVKNEKFVIKQFLSLPNVTSITVSNHSKYSLLSFIPEVESQNIPVFYSPSTICDNNCSFKKNYYGKYWLMVSANRWVKNSIRGMLAFDQLFSEHPNLKGSVIITGISRWNEINVNIKNKNRFVLFGYVSEEDLRHLYHYAYSLVYPSLNEGFGYPPLEAMHEGCPVCASSIASLPEICGDSVLYFNPLLISEIKMRILQMEDVNTHYYFSIKGKRREELIRKKQEDDLLELCKLLLSFLKEQPNY